MIKTLLMLLLIFTFQPIAKAQSMADIYDFEVTKIDGNKTTMAQYEGKVLLIVNVASDCGFTYQYDGLEDLYKKYKDRGLVVLGFPCNQFASQEPASEKEIHNFCRVKFGVTFPMFSKIKVNGDDTHPLYAYLKSEKTGFLGTEFIKWNFTKFLVDRKGKVVKRFSSSTKPLSLELYIELLLDQ